MGNTLVLLGGIGVDQMAEDINAMLSQLVVVFTSQEQKIDISKHWNIVLSANYIQYNHQFISMSSSAHENASKSRSLESRLLTGLLFLLLSWRFDSSIRPRQSCFQVCCHLY